MDYKRIQKECFWDMDITALEIKGIVHGKEKRMKKIIFEKILLNSSKVFLDLKLFKTDDLEELLNNFKIPKFNREYIRRRKNLAEVYFLDKELLIDELKWVI
ncbi:MAG: hypothetical protein U9N77_03210 [Thermodesulfobacteriota bacterium]|nr:hypothetical protein [Thermodesulfobacteriota bacterium]